MQITTRHLPHWHEIGQPLFVTFRLHGSLPRGRYFDRNCMTSGEAFVTLDRLLDRGETGPLYLKMPEIGGLVADAIEERADVDYALHAWVVMPNHVHMLITPRIAVSLLMRSLKGTTARAANLALGLEGQPFWQHESYDRLVRGPEEFRRIHHYILQNPVRAGLVASAEEFLFSSAGGGLKPAAI